MGRFSSRSVPFCPLDGHFKNIKFTLSPPVCKSSFPVVICTYTTSKGFFSLDGFQTLIPK